MCSDLNMSLGYDWYWQLYKKYGWGWGVTGNKGATVVAFMSTCLAEKPQPDGFFVPKSNRNISTAFWQEKSNKFNWKKRKVSTLRNVKFSPYLWCCINVFCQHSFWRPGWQIHSRAAKNSMQITVLKWCVCCVMVERWWIKGLFFSPLSCG